MNEQLERTIKQLFDVDTEVKLTRPDSQFGDYATNVAMQLAKTLGQNPRDIAGKIAEELQKNEDFSEVTVAGPGFINIRLSDPALIRSVYTRPTQTRAQKSVVIETNNPNPFKPMHIGHAYNAILADTMANLLAVSGASVHRVSYHGNVGSHVGKSMYAIMHYCGGDVSKLDAIEPQDRNEFMGKMYAEGAAAAKTDEAVKARVDELARQSFVLDDPVFKEIYEKIAGWSYEQIDAVVARLGNVKTEKRYVESAAEAPGKKLIIEKTPEVFTLSDGAYIFEGSKHGAFDNVFIASNGNGLYGAHDMGLVQLKFSDYPDMSECIVVTGEEQGAYFRGVIKAAELAIPELKGKLENVATGLVKLTTGKMSSRTGDVITIDWLFDAFSNAIVERGGEATTDVVTGALRYQFLKVKTGSDVIFDINDAVSLTGNTGSYLQYAHARAKQILKKSGETFSLPSVVYDEDRALLRKLSEFHDTVDVATRTLEPHHIAQYLFELAQEFNRYYEKNRVIGDDKEVHRVSLVALYADILAAGLAILGITAPDQL